MIVARTIAEVRQAVAAAKAAGKTVGFVPTMGALHQGHFSLIDAARRQCGFVAVSIFVNPTQFGPNEDLSKYPRPIEKDLAGCQAHQADMVFVPEVTEMYPPGAVTMVHVDKLTEGLCGASRPGHFDGVCTVVAKLFNIVQPDTAFFGAKDYQQAAVIRRMAADLDMPLKIEVCPTVREADGLAMSSRNMYLSPEERAQALCLNESLRLAADLVKQGIRSAAELKDAVRRHIAQRGPLGKVDYIEIVDPDTLRPVETISGPAVALVAVKFPSARLIDNMLIGVQ